MSSEIIESVGLDNYDGGFQHLDFIFSQNFISLPILRIILITKVTIGRGTFGTQC
jgi:hypothetical protein